MRRIHCTVDSNEDFYGLPVRTLVHDRVKCGPVDIEVRIGPIIGAHEYVVLTRWFGKPAWSESWRLGELSGFQEEFSRDHYKPHFKRYLQAISALVDQAGRVEAQEKGKID